MRLIICVTLMFLITFIEASNGRRRRGNGILWYSGSRITRRELRSMDEEVEYEEEEVEEEGSSTGE